MNRILIKTSVDCQHTWQSALDSDFIYLLDHNLCIYYLFVTQILKTQLVVFLVIDFFLHKIIPHNFNL